MCVFKPKQGSDKVDVLSQVDNRKECKMGVGWCCCKGVLSPEVGIGSWICHVALDKSLFVGLAGSQRKGYHVPRVMLETSLALSPSCFVRGRNTGSENMGIVWSSLAESHLLW